MIINLIAKLTIPSVLGIEEEKEEGKVLGIATLPLTGANVLSAVLTASGLLGVGLWLRRRLLGKRELA